MAHDTYRSSDEFDGTTLQDIENYLKRLGRTWGRERGGWVFMLRFIILPLLMGLGLIWLVFTQTPYRDIPLGRIWIGGSLMLTVVIYWLIETTVVSRRWFIVTRGIGSAELRLWTGTLRGTQRPATKFGHVAIRIDNINGVLRVRSEHVMGKRLDSHFNAEFLTFTALQQTVNHVWGQGTCFFDAPARLRRSSAGQER